MSKKDNNLKKDVTEPKKQPERDERGHFIKGNTIGFKAAGVAKRKRTAKSFEKQMIHFIEEDITKEEKLESFRKCSPELQQQLIYKYSELKAKMELEHKKLNQDTDNEYNLDLSGMTLQELQNLSALDTDYEEVEDDEDSE